MTRPTTSPLAALAALVLASALTLQAQEPSPTPTGLPTTDLPEEQIAKGLVTAHPLSLPSPPELLLVLAKNGNPKWRKLYHPVIKGQESDRIKTALRFGLSVTEAHLANMARDAQKIRDVTTDLQRYAKVLGISDGLADTSRTINTLAEEKAWSTIAYELEALASQASSILISQRDTDLALLITTGLWTRLLHVSSSLVTEEDFPETTVAIGDPQILTLIVAPLAASKAPTVSSIRDQVAKIERLWSPEKLSAGHEFDDALIGDTHKRLTSVINTFTR
jgi:hypothetical protein